MKTFPDDSLPHAAPGERGVNALAIRNFVEAVEREGLELHSFMLWKKDAVIASAWWAPYGPELRHTTHSATKSFVSTGIGLAVDRGLLSLDDTVISFFPEYLPPDASPLLAQMTVHHLLTMTSGHATGISGGEWRRLKTSWIAAFLREPMVYPPGERFVYCSGCSYMLAAILQKVTGETVRDWMERHLFTPMGIRDLSWDTGVDGVNTGGNGISAKTSDLLKLGILHLKRGAWNGEQLLGQAWVEAATGMQVADVSLGVFDGKRYAPAGGARQERDEMRTGYGYQWWRGPDDSFYASGLFGQCVFVFPALDTVFAYTGGMPSGEKGIQRLFWQHVMPALPGGTAGWASGSDDDLVTYLATRRIGGIETRPVPAVRRQVSLSCEIAANEDGVTRIGIFCDEYACRLVLEDERGAHTIVSAFEGWHAGETTMTGWKLHHSYQPEEMRVLGHACWQDDDTLVLDWFFIETTFHDRVVLRLEDGGFSFDRSVNTNSTITRMPQLAGKSKEPVR